MAQTTQDLSADWELITSATTFTVQNISKSPAEIVFSSTVPAPSDKGFVIGYTMGLTDASGTGNLYGKGAGSTIALSV